jgi:ribosomal peptide maturation radical SAM protein 1
MGGAVFARYPFVDALFSGYAERSFPDWVDALPPRADGPITDDGVENLDDLAIPAYEEYIAALEQHRLVHKVDPKVLIESSRGCWYGQKQHCTFCGINGLQMRYRHKSADRVFEEVQVLSRYGLPLWSADNIMPLDYFDTLFPRLERENVSFNGFYEIKSNSSRSELETLARVGIRHLQPGIESFSTPVLRQMKKGVTGIQNVWFLRASRELGIECQWNVLWGFPEEEPAEYEKMASLFPKLSHLEAPASSGKILLLRHSPNHTKSKELGFDRVVPFPSYEKAFGQHPNLDDQAYLFDHEYADGRDPHSYTRGVDEQAERWIRTDRRQVRPVCQVVWLFGKRFVLDSRRLRRVGITRPRLSLLDEDAWALLVAIESPVPRSRLEAEWQRSRPLGPLLSRFIQKGWALQGDGRVVRLVVVRDDPSLVAEATRLAKKKARGAKRLLLRYA